MKELFIDGLAVAYLVAGVVCSIAYLPTIKDLYLHKNASANTTTYLLWTITALITLLYSCLNSSDVKFRLISIINLVFCALVLFLSIKNKPIGLKPTGLNRLKNREKNA